MGRGTKAWDDGTQSVLALNMLENVLNRFAVGGALNQIADF